MIGLSGRFGFSLDECWSLTPGEFEDYVSGAVDREREQRYGNATIVSVILATMGGHKVSAEALLGEVDEDDPLLDDPFQKYLRFREDAKRNAERRREREAREYLPDDIILDDE